MLRLSRLTDYAVVVLSAMARMEERIVSSVTLAEQTKVPEPTVSKLLKLMAKDGILVSVRGAAGGYRLDKPAAAISIGAVVTVVEGPVALTACVEGSAQPCGLESCCALKGKWNPVNTAIRAALESVSVADIMNETTAKGVAA